MAFPPEAGPLPSDFRAGDRVEFVQACDAGLAPDDPFYQPPVEAGCRGLVLDVGSDHVRVRMDDRGRWPRALLVWGEARFPDEVHNSLGCLKRLPKEPTP